MALSNSVPASFMAFESAPSLLTPPTISPLDVSRLSTSHRVTCIEDILSRETAVTVIDLYFNHVRGFHILWLGRLPASSAWLAP